MIFAKVDVTFPRHYRLVDVRLQGVRTSLGIRSKSNQAHADALARTVRAAALGVWTAVLCYTREQMLDGFCPLGAIRDVATDEIIDELVVQGLLSRAEQNGRPGVLLVNYAKHNETKVEIERRMSADRVRKKYEPALRSTPSVQPDSTVSPPPRPSSGDHQALIAHFVAEFERLKGAKPVIGAKGGAGAKKLLEGRTLAEAKAVVDRALSDPWWLDKNPDLAAIAGKINSFIGRRTSPSGPLLVQPTGGSWKKAGGAE